MEPTVVIAALTAAVAAVVASWPAGPPHLRPPGGRFLGLAVLVMALWRMAPTGAVVPPPQLRIVEPSPSHLDPAASRLHTVVAGECLWRIAANVLAGRHGEQPTSAQIARFWPRIYEANRDVIGADPALILVGQVLEIPEG